MTRDPVAAAFEVSPHWLHRIHAFDALEIAPCVVVGIGVDGREILERSYEREAFPACWTVYGHLTTGGVEWFADFPSVVAAEAFTRQLRDLYPHLLE